MYTHSIPFAALAVSAVIVMGAARASAQDYTPTEIKGTQLSTEWQDHDGVVTRGPDGKVVFLFGEVQPSVICSPLQVCDIELEPGEIVRDVLVGDTVRWKVEPATSGLPGAQAVHLIVKPAESGLTTSMVVTTSKRTYHIELKSHDTHYMARVGFEYPEDVEARFAEINARVEASIMPGAGVPADQLDFGYRMTGAAGWKPTRIYSDGLKTYIQFPRSLSGQDAPVLFVTSGGENRIVNYRLNGTMMVVDFYIDQAILVSGVGSKQQKITIRRGG
ncbi:MAG: P-type conjugative transfer protein TrbG [Devosia sp.]|uniref:P-type conjugative transfer protein TrbG n=1 Tax=Devosia sp. TaxID=1871048 RepID=UPI001AC0AEBA|nr:P-type conjugative transfer protein TrbG [Devosia sp.]MBN9309129.1 P-type conjugative transfer protein TrbG [Devosia sp.]